MLLTLPPELIQRVVRLSLDLTNDGHPTSDDRTNLQNLSLVHSSVQPWARAELWHTYDLTKVSQIERGWDAAQQGATVFKLVRSLLCGEATPHAIGEGWEDNTVNLLMKCAAFVDWRVQHTRVSSLVFGSMPCLRKLNLFNSSVIVTALAPSSLPRITHLAINWDGTRRDSCGAILLSVAFPNLHTLALAIPAEQHSMFGGLAAISPQLESFALRDPSGDYSQSIDWSKFQSLRTLLLRVGAHPDGVSNIARALKGLPTTLNVLKIVICADCHSFDPMNVLTEHMDFMNTLRQQPKLLDRVDHLLLVTSSRQCPMGCTDCNHFEATVRKVCRVIELIGRAHSVVIDRVEGTERADFSEWQTFLD